MTNGFKYPDYEWKIGETLPLLLDDTSNVKFVLVILNTPLLWPFDYLRSVWKKGNVRVSSLFIKYFSRCQHIHIKKNDYSDSMFSINTAP